MKKLGCALLVLLLVSCKTKAVLNEGKAADVLSAEKIIENHYNTKIDFSSLYIRASAKYRDENQSQNVSAEIKIKKDEKILVSIRFLGITMAKALITPNEVKYYEKINGTFFEGDYASLSKWLGTDLDFQKVQNLLLGKPIDDLTKGKYTSSIVERFYKLKTIDNQTEKSFLFEGEHYLLKKQEIVQPVLERDFEVNYPNFQEVSATYLPASLLINAFQKSQKTEISIEYNNITFNEDLSFPYSVPGDYERIFIK
ncbi:DUF4292 domain-containing protein [Flavobacterium silvisoli]|uniref:DUF4292 domain-containing protein n=1 Tax=Flavobacterium silvisoli TaxID=2529433 RepID=A0A4Q9Z915_9FLAO|nr:DUF4292 domain-containing protein [Flavobacterium silvisoli]TBX71267.1 DUF4292 domain-containing protein [Flavobacterium silvisoli]